jgi:hypothetical protein
LASIGGGFDIHFPPVLSQDARRTLGQHP